jgi:hypothetical protein
MFKIVPLHEAVLQPVDEPLLPSKVGLVTPLAGLMVTGVLADAWATLITQLPT